MLTLIELQHRSCRMITRLSALLVSVVALLTPIQVIAQETRSRSILVLDQSDMRGPFYYHVFSGLRSVVNAGGQSHITLYTESLDLSRFRGNSYEASLLRHLKDKYQDIPIGAVVAIGSATLELVLSWRSELWPAVPVVFAMVDEIDSARLQLPDGVTGTIVKLPLADSIQAARAVVPGLQTVVFGLRPLLYDQETRYGNRAVDLTCHRSGAQGTYLGREPDQWRCPVSSVSATRLILGETLAGACACR
jgi:hypothetical protein